MNRKSPNALSSASRDRCLIAAGIAPSSTFFKKGTQAHVDRKRAAKMGAVKHKSNYEF